MTQTMLTIFYITREWQSQIFIKNIFIFILKFLELELGLLGGGGEVIFCPTVVVHLSDIKLQ